MALDLENTEALYAAMFSGKQNKTLADVWNVLADEARDNPSLTVDNDNAPNGRLKITSSDGTSLRIDGKAAGPSNVYLRNNFSIVTNKEYAVPISSAADALVQFLSNNRGGPKAG